MELRPSEKKSKEYFEVSKDKREFPSKQLKRNTSVLLKDRLASLMALDFQNKIKSPSFPEFLEHLTKLQYEKIKHKAFPLRPFEL